MSKEEERQLAGGTQRWSIQQDPDSGEQGWEWDFTAPDDIDDLFERVRERKSTPLDHELFDACLLDRFITQADGGEGQVDPWILRTLSEMFFKVLCGGEWSDEIRLPGRPASPIRPKKEERGLRIYCDVTNAVNQNNCLVTEAIQVAADSHFVSYETARAGYYQWKDRLSKK